MFFKRSTVEGQVLSIQSRGVVYKQNGGILPKPVQTRLGLLRAGAVVLPFLCLGATVSRRMAVWLEENDYLTQYSEVESMIYNSEPCKVKILWESPAVGNHDGAWDPVMRCKEGQIFEENK